MNKQQLAQRIWESANNMRSKIEANDYKDYILGFIFYKFLSEKEEQYLEKIGMTHEDMKEYLHGDDPETIENYKKANKLSDEEINQLVEDWKVTIKDCKEKLGYFIAYENLFSTWIQDSDFDISNVRDALSAFNRNINPVHKKLFEKIFDTLETGLSKLGTNAGEQTKAAGKLIELINPIPMDGKQGFDVLGFIYEYLIEKFAANAGKKAGEFYTPHEVSQVMSEIVANHLKDRETIDIYDPTSGSGSLLITIGESVSKYLADIDKVKFYAQELKENTYALTRMNLIQHDIKPGNIIARNGDTLADDWPYFDDDNREGTYRTLWVDAVVSNPPYSQKWTPKDDPRFSEYGIAPKAKADYAFLLHDLYHLKDDGIMTIVLPHGVLFRGGEEGNIRRALVENDHIEAIIGLPANIFFGTGIPTIIMVLRKHRNDSDVLIIDASKGYEKKGKSNALRASDIKRIVDTVINKPKNVEKYAKLVSKDEIRANDYNLNIPRYVDSSEKAESYDIYASMFGGVPNKEIAEFKDFWIAFPSLRDELFIKENDSYSTLKVSDIKKGILENSDVKSFIAAYGDKFEGFDGYLKSELIFDDYKDVKATNVESKLTRDIFARLEGTPLTDRYGVYQLFNNEWIEISNDLYILSTEGLKATKIVDPNMVLKKKDGKEVEIQEGWRGRVIPFELIHGGILKAEADSLVEKETELSNIPSLYSELLESMDEDVRSELDSCISEEGDSFVNAEITKYAKKAKKEKDDSDAAKLAIEVNKIIDSEKALKKEIKTLENELLEKTISTIEGLSDEEAKDLLIEKWIYPIVNSINKMPEIILNDFVGNVVKLSEKYNETYLDIDNAILNVENSLGLMLDGLEANEFDIQGINEFKKLLGGE